MEPGFAARAVVGTLLSEGWGNATADHTVKIVAPAVAAELVAPGKVAKPGRRMLTVVSVGVHAAGAEGEVLCAIALVTFRNRPPSGWT